MRLIVGLKPAAETAAIISDVVAQRGGRLNQSERQKLYDVGASHTQACAAEIRRALGEKYAVECGEMNGVLFIECPDADNTDASIQDLREKVRSACIFAKSVVPDSEAKIIQ